jgi:hypothetical protein
MQREKLPPGPSGLGLDPSEMVPAAMTWRSTMMQKYLSPELAQIADDICFLANNAICPRRQRELLINWSGNAKRGVRSAYREDALCGVVDALITISHANAAFSIAPAPPFYMGKPKVNIDDRGGYFAARKAVSALIESEFTCENLRLMVAKHALARVDRDMSDIGKLLS